MGQRVTQGLLQTTLLSYGHSERPWAGHVTQAGSALLELIPGPLSHLLEEPAMS